MTESCLQIWQNIVDLYAARIAQNKEIIFGSFTKPDCPLFVSAECLFMIPQELGRATVIVRRKQLS